MLVVAFGAWIAGCAAAGDPTPPQPAKRGVPVPQKVSREIHAGLHSLPRVCDPPRLSSRSIDRTTRLFIHNYKRYPSNRFRLQIDDEPGTMLSAILVLRYELSRCRPRRARQVDEVIPPRIRRSLRRPVGSDRR